jgi:hypothetical protein
VEVLHYGYPALSLLYFIFTSTLGFCTTPAGAKKKTEQHDKRRALLSLMVLVVGTYVSSPCHVEMEETESFEQLPSDRNADHGI